MKLNEQTMSSLETILKKAFSDAGTFQKPDSMGEISSALSKIANESKTVKTPVIKRKIKKSDITDILSKGKKKMNLPIGKLFSMGKTNEEETKEATGAGGAGAFSAPLFSETKKEMQEKWSQKYKDSIDCDNPKGFSQKAHCQGKKKKETKEATGSGSAGAFVGPVGFNPNSKFVKDSFKETPKKVETKEATGAASAGAYATPAAWAKSTSAKDWRGKSKTQIPGGTFVQVKKKCKTFPYCNQGDINALKLTKPKKMNESDNLFKKLSEKHNISEDMIKKIIMMELGNKK